MDTTEQKLPTALKRTLEYVVGFLFWVLIGLLLGVVGGVIGGAFSLSIGIATSFRTANPWIIWLLPFAGLLIAYLYHLRSLRPTDTNGVLLALQRPGSVSAITAPLIFVSTVLTHLFGGSAGREGAALQMGGALGSVLAKYCKAREFERQSIIMCGMSAVFAALFGTPMAAAVFAMEVASVGVLQFAAIVPCLTSAITAANVARLMGAHAEAFPLHTVFSFDISNILLVVAVAAIVSVVSIVYCVGLHRTEHILAKCFPNPYVRIAAAGFAIAVLAWLLGTTDYNGAGTHIIERAMEGEARPEAFAVKLLFTFLTAGSGYKGGEIVPAMFIGSTLGCTLASLFGLDPALGAAIGLTAMFCGSLNCPISSLLLSVELFGAENMIFFAITCAVSYMLSANHSLYHQQKILYSKLRPELIHKEN
ncbi:MAG: chloride channel protein [Ruminococcaceae bacterium]|nr:chloride channel protein [Oscillospiraceae bacterium]